MCVTLNPRPFHKMEQEKQDFSPSVIKHHTLNMGDSNLLSA